MNNTPSCEALTARIHDLEEQLKKSEAKMLHFQHECERNEKFTTMIKLMLGNAPDLIWAKDMNDQFLYANKSMCDNLLKCNDVSEAIGKTDVYFALRERAAGYEHTFGEICLNSDHVVKRTQKPGRFYEHGLVRGQMLILDVYKSPFFDDSGEMIGTVGCGRDITREKQTEETLKKASQAMRMMANEIDGVAIQGYNSKREVTLWNKASEKLYGYTFEEARGRKLEDLIIPDGMRDEVIGHIDRWMRHEEPIPSTELVLRDKDGHDVHVYSNHTMQETVHGKELFCIDIDLAPIKQAHEEKRVLTQQLERAHRMEAIGTLASGVAHDFNNILSAIIGYGELIKSELEDNQRATGYVDSMLKATERATDLVRQILAFTRKAAQEKEPVRLSHIVDEAVMMLRSSIPTTVAITTRYASDQDVVLADPSGIHRIVVNLVTNARHALHNDKGKIEITLTDVVLQSQEIPPEWGAGAGPFVVLEIRDDGCGMEQKVISQMFEPYFTTRERGEGTGLGMATVHGVVLGCKGFIEVQSRMGQGTAIKVYLPLLEDVEVEKQPEQQVELPSGQEHILYVDDEEALCEIGKKILERLGYRVTVQNFSKEALKVFQENPDQFDLIISDQTMPDLTGFEFAQHIFKLRAGFPFILYTGDSSGVTPEMAKEIGIRRYLYKPITQKTLASSIREVLDEQKE